MTLGGFSIRKLRGNSGLFSQSLRLSVRPFRSQFVRSFSIWHHHGSCEVGARPLVALTFFVKFWSGNDFDHFPIERPLQQSRLSMENYVLPTCYTASQLVWNATQSMWNGESDLACMWWKWWWCKESELWASQMYSDNEFMCDTGGVDEIQGRR